MLVLQDHFEDHNGIKTLFGQVGHHKKVDGAGQLMTMLLDNIDLCTTAVRSAFIGVLGLRLCLLQLLPLCLQPTVTDSKVIHA